MKPPVSLIDFNTTVPKTRLQRMFAIMTHNDIMTPRHFLLYLFLGQEIPPLDVNVSQR